MLLAAVTLGVGFGPGSASAQDGCEYVTTVEFMQNIISKASECRWSEDANRYDCTKADGPTWYLTIEADDGSGIATAERWDGFKVYYACSCSRACAFDSPASRRPHRGE